MSVRKLSTDSSFANSYKLGRGQTSVAKPGTPIIGTASPLTPSSISVAFTPGLGGGATSYTVTSTPGSITGTGSSSPITVSGLSAATNYTFTVSATNANGTSAQSSASNSTQTQTATSLTGGTIYYDTTYVYHKFTANGNFVVPSGKSTAVDYVIIAGGGGNGESGFGGGGGAGGAKSGTSGTLSNQTVAVTIGAGGVNGSAPTHGSNTVFGAIATATGGGNGGSGGAGVTTGGSGGGGNNGSAGAAGTAGEGNSGGSGSPSFSGGRGGGKGTAGGIGGGGGEGSSAFSSYGIATSSGELYNGLRYFAAGGNGANNYANNPGDGSWGGTNLGAGGGGSSGAGAGILIVRYPKANVGI